MKLKFDSGLDYRNTKYFSTEHLAISWQFMKL